MKRIQILRHLFCAAVLAVLPLAVSCSGDELSSPDAGHEGMVRVNFLTSGTYGAPFSDLKAATSADRHEIPEDENGVKYQPGPIPDGTTLWVAVYEGTPDEAESATLREVKSYRVSGSSMIPCLVDEAGNVQTKPDGGEIYDTPLYLPAGSYFFRVVGPARQLVPNEEGQPVSLSIDNGEAIIANDERYAETAGDASAVLTDENPDRYVTLKPLINQTARLKFTLYSPEDDPFVHTLQMQPIGVEVSGLQNYYTKGGDAEGKPWNWTLCALKDTLEAYPGNKNTIIYLKNPTETTANKFVIETPILPTDATSTPLIVLFNMNVNGNPTQFEMMLNRKVFRAGYSYHYRGRVKIDAGVSALDWESVSWSADIPFFP